MFLHVAKLSISIEITKLLVLCSKADIRHQSLLTLSKVLLLLLFGEWQYFFL